jgi:Zn-dependent protease with chaperone function
MPMTREEFDGLVRRVEAQVGHRPGALRLRVAGLAFAGYAGLLGGLLGVALLASLFFAFMFYADREGQILLGILGGAILFGGGWAVLRVLLVRLPAPEGRAVTRAEAPALHSLLDELGVAARSARFHHVLVVSVCNASVVQVPRLGVLGWPRNYLLLGLPLLEGLSIGEVRAVLAHEFAHLSREHGRFGRWIYRLRRSWEKVFEQLAQPQLQGGVSLRPLVVKFINWFWPRFNAHAFVLSRANEYEADAVAAQLGGAKNIASALLRIEQHHRHLEEAFWPGVWKLANVEPLPPTGVYLRLRDTLRAGPADADGRQWVVQAFRLTTTNADTHPCLTDRWRALGRLHELPAPMLLPAPQPSAAEVLLGPALESIRDDVEQRWRKDCEAPWRDRHARATALSHRLTSIDTTVATAAADVDRLWDKARVLIDLHGDDGAKPLLREVLALRPDHPAANFHLGRMLLEADDAEGEELMHRAMNEDDQLVPHACGVLHAHFRRTGRADKLRETTARLDRYEQDLAASHAERRSVRASDPLIPHGLSAGELTALRELLASEPDLVAAELGRKELRYFSNQKLFLLCVHARRAWHRLPNSARDQELVNRLSQRVRLPGRVLVFAPNGDFRPLARKLRTVPGAAIIGRSFA